ncbi:hypothetical protein ABIE26_002669 [Pedobacter africanus]|uniref:Uncharacterized protein n=1 Tax=Pedobacter africanus TaxID=151894 RepID=A0ACC6KXF0_9SPHI|nr:hypothetical protein [Pedobacter africanus]MDR6783942.1 hypothetical protein [Pedobacter africanus]
MKKNNLINRSGLLIKSFALGLFLMIASATSSFAQYIQIEVRYDGVASSDPLPWVLEMKAYADAACTIPTTYSGNVKFKTGSMVFYNSCAIEQQWTTDDTMTIADFNSATYLYYGRHENLRYADCGHIEDNYDYFMGVIVEPSSGYQVATQDVIFP